MYKAKGKLNERKLDRLGEATLLPSQPETLQDKLVNNGKGVEPPKPPRRHGHRFLIALACLIVGLSGVIGIVMDRMDQGSIAVEDLTSLSVVLNINSTPQIIQTNSATVGQLLSEESIRLTEKDYIGVPMDQPLYDGMRIWLRLAVDVNVVADGVQHHVITQPVTVDQVLDLAGVELDEDDKLSQPPLSYVYGDGIVQVYRMETRTETVEEAIPPGETEQELTYLTPGSRVTVSAGVDGSQLSTYQVTYQDGVELRRELQETQVVREPVDAVIGVGPTVGQVKVSVLADGTEIAPLTATTGDGASFYYTDTFEIETTAYTWTGNRTRTGTWPSVGTVAVDPEVIPLGTKLYIEGYGFATAADTGGAIQGNIIDLYMDTQQECVSWGRRDVVAYVLAQ